MHGLRDEITRSFLRLARRAQLRPKSLDLAETDLASDERIGTQLGSYKILRKLGSGGMAQVYLAVHIRLGRNVALKFVPPEFATDTEMLRRLEQEAETASGLNHPNILTIYEICKEDEEVFIASEFVEGRTLREALHHGALTLQQAVDIATQVTSALIASHSRNIIHRDLKPGNIMIRHDGYVKVIDFGLAKNVDAGAEERTRMSITRQGAVIGTVAYMSPEQARGDKLDHRTDLWSLGVVLYEMVSSRKPFNGETESHLIVEILDKPVPSLLAGRAVPPALWAIIHRALTKDKDKRYQSAAEMHADLLKLSLGSQAKGLGLDREALPVRRRSLVLTALMPALILLALLALALVTDFPFRYMPVDWFRVESVDALTFNARTKIASISPDGKYLAFVVGDSASNGLESLMVKQIGSLSQEVKIPPRKIDYRGITFSPEGHTMYVVAKDQKLMGRLYAVPLVGEASERPLLEDIDGPVAFSPTGDRFAFVRYMPHDSESRVEVASLNLEPDSGIKPSTLFKIRNTLIMPWLAWGTQRNPISMFSVLSNSGEANASESRLHWIGLDHSERTQTISNWASTGQLWLTPGGKTILVTAATRRQSETQSELKEIAIKTGEIHDVVKDLSGYRSLSLTKDGNYLAAVKIETRTRLWISDDDNSKTGQTVLSDAEAFSSLAWADEEHAIVSAPRGRYLNLSSFDITTKTRTTLTDDSFIEENAASIPRSRAVVFSSTRGGGSHIWKFNPESSTYTQLTSGTGYDQQPAVSPDGRWVIYTSWQVNTSRLKRVSVEGGPVTAFSDLVAQQPAISPDGKWVACRAWNPVDSDWTAAILAWDGNTGPRYLPGVQSPFAWSPDGNSLTSVITDVNGISNLWAIPLDDPRLRSKLTNFDDEKIMRFAWSPSGRRLACVRGLQGTDAVLFKRQR